MDLTVHAYQGATRNKETVFNVSVSPGAKLSGAADLWLRRPGLVFVSDDFRGGFQAYVHASAHPYVDLTGAEAVPGRSAGSFRLDDVPAGTYELVCWHEGLAPAIGGDERRPLYGPGPEIRLSRSVSVVAGVVTVADFVVPAPPAPPR